MRAVRLRIPLRRRASGARQQHVTGALEDPVKRRVVVEVVERDVDALVVAEVPPKMFLEQDLATHKARVLFAAYVRVIKAET